MFIFFFGFGYVWIFWIYIKPTVSTILIYIDINDVTVKQAFCEAGRITRQAGIWPGSTETKPLLVGCYRLLSGGLYIYIYLVIDCYLNIWNPPLKKTEDSQNHLGIPIRRTSVVCRASAPGV